MTQHSTTNTSDREPKWVSYTSVADFWGDSRSSQLSFRKKSRIEVDANQTSQIGWLWGKSGDKTGWFPEWAAEKRLSSRSSHHRHKHRDRISPKLEKITEDGLDRRSSSKKSNRNKSSNDLRNLSSKGGRNKSTKGNIDTAEARRKARMSRRHSTGAGLALEENSKTNQTNAEWKVLDDSNGKSANNQSSKSSHRSNHMTDFHKNVSSRSSRSISGASTASLNSSFSSLNDSFGPESEEKPEKKQLFGKFRRRGSQIL